MTRAVFWKFWENCSPIQVDRKILPKDILSRPSSVITPFFVTNDPSVRILRRTGTDKYSRRCEVFTNRINIVNGIYNKRGKGGGKEDTSVEKNSEQEGIEENTKNGGNSHKYLTSVTGFRRNFIAYSSYEK